jgi:hypothetical protein
VGRLVAVVIVLLASTASAQSDLDALMERVLARRDDNWTKLQQYVLNERETLRVTGPGDTPLYGFTRDYFWYPRDRSTAAETGAQFVRSPISVDGVAVSDEDRERAEQEWMRDRPPAEVTEPRFVSSAYFLRFTFDPGRYALVGRETLDGRDVLRIEYYPTKMFAEGRTRPNRRLRQRDEAVERKMNKVSLVTLWILPDEHQIVRYAFENVDADFLPAQHLLRFDRGTATMEMSQPFPGVWLPRRLHITFEAVSAAGRVQAQYASEYFDYREAAVTTRVR